LKQRVLARPIRLRIGRASTQSCEARNPDSALRAVLDFPGEPRIRGLLARKIQRCSLV